jgi:UDPglucose 6-dehydrogenase
VVGSGYVGLTTAACLADLGHEVAALDIDQQKVDSLRAGKPPIYESGLEPLLERTTRAGRLRFTTSYAEAVGAAEFIFLAVGTPIGPAGQVDLTFIKQAAVSIGQALRQPVIVVTKSTVPVGTGDLVSTIIRQHLAADIPFQVVSNPEFLREGTAIRDFMHPDRLVLGSHDREAARSVATLYAGLESPVLVTDLYSAEMIKYASNAFLAARISFINEIAGICESVGADVTEVAAGMSLDHRIGPLFLQAGLGYGGSCFPKDVRALALAAEQTGHHPAMLDAVMRVNLDQRRVVVEKVRTALGGLRDQVVGLLGLAYKANTDDVRGAPSLDLIQHLLLEGATVRAFDPKAMPVLKRELNSIEYCDDAYALSAGADALIVVTDWEAFKALDLRRIKHLMRHPVMVDGRNLFDPATMRRLGFLYQGIGRPSSVPRPGRRGLRVRRERLARVDYDPAVAGLAPAS